MQECESTNRQVPLLSTSQLPTVGGHDSSQHRWFFIQCIDMHSLANEHVAPLAFVFRTNTPLMHVPPEEVPMLIFFLFKRIIVKNRHISQNNKVDTTLCCNKIRAHNSLIDNLCYRRMSHRLPQKSSKIPCCTFP